jgi:hypothetical protein
MDLAEKIAAYRKELSFSYRATEWYRLLGEAEIALRASPSEAPGDGWKLVPMEPVAAQWKAASAADEANTGGRVLGPKRYEWIYRAMLVAAPSRSEEN